MLAGSMAMGPFYGWQSTTIYTMAVSPTTTKPLLYVWLAWQFSDWVGLYLSQYYEFGPDFFSQYTVLNEYCVLGYLE